jgi:hypothetical protein
MSGKYDELAARFTAHEYGDPGLYFRHRAEIVASRGPPHEAGDLDLACADGSFGFPLQALGLDYTGLDASEAMAAAARGRGLAVVVGDLLAYVPPQPVATTTIFRSLHFVPDRTAFFAHVAGFTEKKLVFDASPRRHPPERLRRELADAGWTRLELHPFFVPQHRALPGPAAAALLALERSGPLARALLRLRFNVIAAASR